MLICHLLIGASWQLPPAARGQGRAAKATGIRSASRSFPTAPDRRPRRGRDPQMVPAGRCRVQHPLILTAALPGTDVAEKENLRVKLDTACGNNLFLYRGSWQKGLSTAAGFEACLHSNKLLHSIHF